MDNSGTKTSNSLDVVAFLVACLVGYILRTYLPAGAWAAYTSVLVSYHLFLAWLLISADHEVGLSFKIAHTVITHLAFLGCIFAILLARRFIPFFSFFGMGIAGLAVFERTWLFSESHKNETKKEHENLPVSEAIATSSADDYQEWMRFLAQQKPGFSTPGASLKGEYEKWLLARAASRPAASSND